MPDHKEIVHVRIRRWSSALCHFHVFMAHESNYPYATGSFVKWDAAKRWIRRMHKTKFKGCKLMKASFLEEPFRYRYEGD